MFSRENTAKKMDKIVNADDMGMSGEINRAIAIAFRDGCVTSASLMMNAPFAEEAALFARGNPGLKIGVHLVLTEGKPLSGASRLPLLASSGKLVHGFARLLWLSLAHRRSFSEQAETEWRAQIEAAIGLGLEISHLDSHRHVHMIPELFRLACRLRREYGIPRLRVVNESLWRSLSAARSLSCFFDGSLVKYGILKTFYHWNGVPSDTYFYGLVYTGKIWGARARVYAPRHYRAVEVALHPRSETDVPDTDFATAMDKSFPGRIDNTRHMARQRSLKEWRE